MKTIIAALLLFIIVFTAAAGKNTHSLRTHSKVGADQKVQPKSSDAALTDMEVFCQNQDGYNDYAVRVLDQSHATVAIFHMYAAECGTLGTVPVNSSYTIEVSRWSASSDVFTASIVAYNYSDIVQNQSGVITFYDVDLNGQLVVSIY